MRVGSLAERSSDQPPLQHMLASCEKLLSKTGEASRVAIASRVLDAYAMLDGAEKLAFFRALLLQYGVEAENVRAAYSEWNDAPTDTAMNKLFAATEPSRQTLLRRMNLCSGGTLALVGMRKDLLAAIKIDPDLTPIDADFTHLFASWFNRGFLVMRRIDWDTSANILDKIVQYEAVHAIKDWDDLRRRLDPNDRRCYGFFHPATADEPLIFVEVALCRGVPGEIGPLLSPVISKEGFASDTAVFYSISNCQKGLKGISFGNFLIKQVVQELQRDLPRLQTFVTLSPMPRLREWLTHTAADNETKAQTIAELDAKNWRIDPQNKQVLWPRVMSLLSDYLHAKSLKTESLVDPVARFHLGNGACVYQLNWPADLSENGVGQSYGAMINYLYEPDRIEERHEAYVKDGVIAIDAELQRTLNKFSADAVCAV